MDTDQNLLFDTQRSVLATEPNLRANFLNRREERAWSFEDA
jgi:hypothetical protein